MKFVHVADMHLDCAFNFLSNKLDLGDIRRLDQRNAFNKMINYVKENDIKYLFISGDLYEQKSIRESTIEYINNLFKQIPATKIFVTPGDHDPMIKESFYKIYDWAENVKIFGSNVEKVEEDEFIIYGYGFDDYIMNNPKIDEIILDNTSKINILITHSSLDGNKEQNVYNPITTKELKQIGFDYVALGHIHKLNLESSDQVIVYPGSMCSMGFDELEKHGMIVGEITKDADGKVDRKLEFIPLDTKEFVRLDCSVDEMNTLEDLAQNINQMDYDRNKYYEIILVGGRHFEINKYKLYKLIENDSIVKIKDSTKIGIDIEELEKEMSLRGLFVKRIKKKMENGEIEEELFEKALEYGLDSLLS